MADASARQDLGIDLNETVRDHDDADVGIDLNEPVRQPVVEVCLSNPIDGWDELRQEDVFAFSNPVFWDVNGEENGNQDEAVHELTNLNLNGVDEGRHVLPDLNEMPGLDDNGTDPHLDPSQGAVGVRRARKQYSDGTKRAVYAMLLEGSAGGRLPDGLSLQVSLAMDVSLRCVQRMWKEGQGGGVHAVVNKRVNNCGRKRIEIHQEAITAIPFKDRTTLEGLARGLGMARSTVFKRLKEGKIERKPFLDIGKQIGHHVER